MLRFFLELLLLTPSRLFCCLCCLCSLVCCFRSFFLRNLSLTKLLFRLCGKLFRCFCFFHSFFPFVTAFFASLPAAFALDSAFFCSFFHCFIRCLQCSCCFVNFRARFFCVFCPRFWFHHIEFNVNLMLNGFLVAFAVGDRRVRCYVFHTPNHQQARTQEAHHH